MMFGKKKRYLYLSNEEHRIVVQALVKLKNALIQQGRSTDCVDELIGLAAQLLSDRPLFFLVNSYTTGLSPLTMSYLLDLKVKSRFGGHIESNELGLRVSQTGAYLPAGASSRWTAVH